MKSISVGWVEWSDRLLSDLNRETHRRAGELMGFAKRSTDPTRWDVLATVATQG